MQSQSDAPLLRRYVVTVALAAVLICAAISRYCFPFFAFEPDTAAYLFQARLMAEGALSAVAPPDFGFSPSPHINIYDGLWYSKYPFGTSLFLVPGVLVGAPWVMPPLATGLTLLLFFAIVRELFDARVAAAALLLAFLSPTTLLIGGSLLSQPVSRLSLAVFLYAILRMLKAVDRTRRCILGGVAGLALGYAFNTRPLVALVFGAAGAGLLLYRLWQRPDRTAFISALLTMAASGLVMLGLFLAWNAHLTGDPWLLPYNALQRADRMGFGLRGEGYAPLIVDFRIDFTPAYALGRIFWHTLPCVLLNTVGWGWYVPSMFFPSDPRHRFPWLAPVLLLPLFLMLLPFWHRSRSAADVFCGSIFLLTLAALFFQYSDHSTWGATPLNCSYYNEATLFGLIPLMARGILICVEAAPRWLGRATGPLLIALGILLLVNTISTNLAFARQFRKWDPYYQRLPRLVASAGIHNAVVFLPRSRNAPVGEYPFKPIEEADIVYFRLGPLPQWGLDIVDWRQAYARYFAGRLAYLFDGDELRELDVPAE
jgi:hypothetical protein